MISPVALSKRSLAITWPNIASLGKSKVFNLALSIFLICIALILSPLLSISSPLATMSTGAIFPINLLGIT